MLQSGLAWSSGTALGSGGQRGDVFQLYGDTFVYKLKPAFIQRMILHEAKQFQPGEDFISLLTSLLPLLCCWIRPIVEERLIH